MMTKHISQREARRLRRRVVELEEQEFRRRNAWAGEWFGGVEIARIQLLRDSAVPTAIKTARKLTHAVIVIAEANDELRFVALPLARRA